ncbi:MAG: hypothetical protein ACE15F_22770 [bacterium]
MLKAPAWRIAEEFIENEIHACVVPFLNHYAMEDRLRIAKEYLHKYGHLLPSEMTEGSAARIKINLVQVL